MKPDIGLTEKRLHGVANLLSTLLANQTALYIKTRKFHWNVAGESFMEYHLLFEKQYKELEENIDEVAERINKLGSPTIGTLKEYIKLTFIKETPGYYPSSKDMVKELLGDHEAVIKELRKNVEECAKRYEDAGTADFLTKLMEDHETNAWKLRRYLK